MHDRKPCYDAANDRVKTVVVFEDVLRLISGHAP